MLVAAGVLDERQLEAALEEQKRWGEPLGRTLVQMGVLGEEVVLRALSRQLGIPACDPASMELPPGMAGYIGLQLVEQYGVMPVAVDERRRILHVATANPTDSRALTELGARIHWNVQPVVAAPDRIERAIRKYYYGDEGVETKAAPAAPTPAAEHPPAPDVALELESLQTAVDELERLAGSQLRALRILVELLVERGVIRREEYLARLRDGHGTS